MRLTEAQKRWLKSATPDGYLTYYDDGPRKKVNFRTIWNLLGLGLVEQCIHRDGDEWYGYRLTEAGRRALEQEG